MDASINYVYAPGSSATLGVVHTRSATDVVQVNVAGKPTLDSESTAIYGKVTHRILRNLTGSLLAQYQTSEFNGGAYDGDSEDLFLIGVHFDYYFNSHFSAEFGYNYDMLDSDVKFPLGSGLNSGREARSYERNRVYIGLTATY